MLLYRKVVLATFFFFSYAETVCDGYKKEAESGAKRTGASSFVMAKKVDFEDVY